MSLYFPATKVFFVHIPKTGGSWFRQSCLESKIPFSVQKGETTRSIHAPVSDFGRIMRLADHSFTFVRNPVEWYQSWYAFHGHFLNWKPFADRMDEIAPQAPLDPYIGRPFDEWVHAVVSNHPGFVSRLYRERTEGVDFVCTAGQVGKVMQRLGMQQFKGVRLRVNSFEENHPEMTTELRESILSVEGEAMELYCSCRAKGCGDGNS